MDSCKERKSERLKCYSREMTMERIYKSDIWSSSICIGVLPNKLVPEDFGK